MKKSTYTSHLIKLRERIDVNVPRSKRKQKKLTTEHWRKLEKQAVVDYEAGHLILDTQFIKKFYKFSLREANYVHVYLFERKQQLKVVKVVKQQEVKLKNPEKPVESKQARLSRKLNEIREMRKAEERIVGEQTQIVEGFVYLIGNDSYPGWMKVGSALDYEARLTTYNVYCPHSGFKFVGLEHVSDRRQVESDLLTEFSSHSSAVKGEWFKIGDEVAQRLFASCSTNRVMR